MVGRRGLEEAVKHPGFAAAAALAVGLAFAAPAAARDHGRGHRDDAPDTSPGVCGLADLSADVAACSGFYEGNLLNDSPSDLLSQTNALAAIGLADWDGSIVEPQLDLDSQTVDFTTLLTGVSYVGVHWGAGSGSPSPYTPGGVTAFYRLDAGTGLDAFTLAFSSASGARLYYTQPLAVTALERGAQAVPEPGAWALMILGFGVVGATMRRRRAAMA